MLVITLITATFPNYPQKPLDSDGNKLAHFVGASYTADKSELKTKADQKLAEQDQILSKILNINVQGMENNDLEQSARNKIEFGSKKVLDSSEVYKSWPTDLQQIKKPVTDPSFEKYVNDKSSVLQQLKDNATPESFEQNKVTLGTIIGQDEVSEIKTNDILTMRIDDEFKKFKAVQDEIATLNLLETTYQSRNTLNSLYKNVFDPPKVNMIKNINEHVTGKAKIEKEKIANTLNELTKTTDYDAEMTDGQLKSAIDKLPENEKLNLESHFSLYKSLLQAADTDILSKMDYQHDFYKHQLITAINLDPTLSNDQTKLSQSTVAELLEIGNQSSDENVKKAIEAATAEKTQFLTKIQNEVAAIKLNFIKQQIDVNPELKALWIEKLKISTQGNTQLSAIDELKVAEKFLATAPNKFKQHTQDIINHSNTFTKTISTSADDLFTRLEGNGSSVLAAFKSGSGELTQHSGNRWVRNGLIGAGVVIATGTAAVAGKEYLKKGHNTPIKLPNGEYMTAVVQ